MNIGEMQRKLSLWAEQDKERKFYGLFDLICDMDWLWLAYEYVAQNAGSKTAGCDGMNGWEFDQDTGGNLPRLRDSLPSGKFEACPVRRVYIPKANGKRRPLGIPAIGDRVVQGAVKLILEPIFEADLQPGSFGYRPGRTAQEAVQRVAEAIVQCKTRIIDIDLRAYFDKVRHDLLLEKVARRVSDGEVLHLLKMMLKASGKKGVPQGGVMIPP